MPQRGAPQFGASLPHGRRRERPVGPGQFHSERRIRAGQVVPPGRCGFAMVRRSGGATARPLESIWASLPHGRRRQRPVGPGHPSGPCGFARCAAAATARPLDDLEPLCRMGAGRGPSDRAISFREANQSGPWVPPGGADLPWCAAAGAQLPGHWIRFGASLPHGRRRERPVGPGQSFREANQSGPCGASRAVRICHGAPQQGRNCPATGFDLEPLCRMVAAGRGPSDRASFIQRGESEWCLPGGADLPWCAAAGAQLPGHWSRFGASLSHGRHC